MEALRRALKGETAVVSKDVSQIEGSLDGCLVLYDLSSCYLEGQYCELGRFGYSRDGKRHKPQIAFGPLCAANGFPVAVEVFEGNTGDPSTLAAQVEKLKERFGLSRVVLAPPRSSADLYLEDRGLHQARLHRRRGGSALPPANGRLS